MNLTFKVLKVTPAMAAKWLEERPRNRAIGRLKKEEYATRMRHGEWAISQPLLFDADGRLLDGQHRLAAVIAADRTIEFAAIEGYDGERVFGVIDDGKVRQVNDWLHADGVEGSTLIAPGITYLMSLHRGVRWGSRRLNSMYVKPSKREKLDFFSAHEEELERAYETFPRQVKKIMPPGLAFGLYVWLARIDETEAYAFFADLGKGERLAASDPVFILRERLLKERAKNPKTLTEIQIVVWIIQTWNRVRQGLRADPKAQMRLDTRHNFPVPR